MRTGPCGLASMTTLREVRREIRWDMAPSHTLGARVGGRACMGRRCEREGKGGIDCGHVRNRKLHLQNFMSRLWSAAFIRRQMVDYCLDVPRFLKRALTALSMALPRPLHGMQVEACCLPYAYVAGGFHTGAATLAKALALHPDVARARAPRSQVWTQRTAVANRL
eukprot:358308-Chlamydomonas_euryale.AAC.16